MANYSPFECALSDLQTGMLIALRDVHEGWYIEYKRELPNAASMAKSVSAFANTYGGWIFYGVQEKSKEENVAGIFAGISRADVDVGLQRLRQAIAGLVAPSPYFDVRVLWGPCEQICLNNDHAIVCVWVPSSITAPHVHRSGQIYRRVSDGSEPRAENDRFVLDNLWQRGNDLKKSYKRWVKRKPQFSKAESEWPYLRIMLVADPWGIHGQWNKLSTEQVRRILGIEHGIVSAIRFDTVHTEANGFIGRQLRNSDPWNFGISWRFRRALSSEIIVPLKWCRTEKISSVKNLLDGYHHNVRFTDLLIQKGYQAVRIVDLNDIFNVLCAVIETQKRLLAENEWEHGFFAKIQLLNCWRNTPFLDIPRVLDLFEENGVPMCMDSTATVPLGTDPSSFYQVQMSYKNEDEATRIYIEAMRLFFLVSTAFGIPSWIETPQQTGIETYDTELRNAGIRSGEAFEFRRLKKP